MTSHESGASAPLSCTHRPERMPASAWNPGSDRFLTIIRSPRHRIYLDFKDWVDRAKAASGRPSQPEHADFPLSSVSCMELLQQQDMDRRETVARDAMPAAMTTARHLRA